jgi:hypothetical protein
MREFLDSISPKGKYGEYLSGKKVAVVGPSKHLFGSNLGKYIDSHDVVIRMKWEKLLPLVDSIYSEYVVDIGSKTNVVYSATALSDKDRMNKVIKHCDRAGIKHFRVPNSRDNDLFEEEQIADDTTYTFYSAGPFAHEFARRRNTDALKIWPQTGFNAIMESVASMASEVFVCGVTMYHGGDHMFQYDKPKFHLQPVVNKHHGILELDIFKDCISDKIKMDDALKWILDNYKTLSTQEVTEAINNWKWV